jgi:hypothetical protein
MPLSAAAVSELKLEESVMALWSEFLAGYFDGNTHTVGANSPGLKFPKAAFSFQQGRLPQPLNGLGVSVVWEAPSKIKKQWDNVGTPPVRQERAYGWALWMFLVRAELENGDGENAHKQCQSGSDRLYGLLNNSSAVLPLAEKGIHRLRPATPQMVAGGKFLRGDGSYHLRLVTCEGWLRWPVLSQT